MEKVKNQLNDNIQYLNEILKVQINFDLVYRVLNIGGKEACLYFIDGFLKDETMMKLLLSFAGIKDADMPTDAHEMSKKKIPYGEVDLKDNFDDIIKDILSGVPALFIDGYDKCILIDCRTYPARSVSEPEKDKALRGSKDGFVETIVFNTALLRRRIRSSSLRMEMYCVGQSSKTDVAVCYVEDRVDQKLLKKVVDRIANIRIDALTVNQESLAECLFQGKWYNPFPKFKYTERPDTATAQLLEGNIVIFVDNSPSAMILPTSVFDIIDEADDYYFPPVTGTYLRLSRFVITVLTYLLTPTFVLLMANETWIPESFQFIMMEEESNIPVVIQFLILELAIDGLKLAAVNTPSMLTTPLSVMAGIVLGQFSVDSGWFNAEVMLYMSFVAIANYTQANYEMGYALKFLRIITLVLTGILGIYGYVAGILLALVSILFNKTISGDSYGYPLFPFNAKKLARRLFRTRAEGARNVH